MFVHKPPVLEVVAKAMNQAASLGSNLLQLAVAEIGESAGSIVKGLVGILAGLFVALIGVLFLLHAAVAGLVQHGWSEAVAYLMVGGGGFVLGFLLLLFGALSLRGASPVPHRTIREARAFFKNQESAE